MMGRLEKVRTYAALGAANLGRVAAYRIGLKTRLHPAVRLGGDTPVGPFFGPAVAAPPLGAIARESWRASTLLFSWSKSPIADIPDWHANPFKGQARADAARHWSKLADFDPEIGDIKAIWEASRFDWLLAMAERAALGEKSELARLNRWLEDWIRKNPPYLGVNWKCGQEASIRVIHLAVAALLLGQVEQPAPGLVDLLRLHLRRIAPTMAYAIGQQNNHGTSEAAALFIGGSWLELLGAGEGRRWRETGARWLEDRAAVLIEPDGTFSQYSVNYHRLLLDTYSVAEVWRRRLKLPRFTSGLLGRLEAATMWLRQMTDPATGDAPNIGANDGARILALVDSDYRDFRPAVQLSAALFLHSRAFRSAGPWDQPLVWLGVEKPGRCLPEPESQTFPFGGLHVLRRGNTAAYLRFPRFRFRPSHADALHLDLWVGGRNVLRDGGTFSYASHSAVAYFSGTVAHNTVQIDGRDQMPRLGRFLFGSWLEARDVACQTAPDGATAAAGYRDAWGAEHRREVVLSEGRLVCRDTLRGNAERGILRWRMEPGNWTQSGNTVTNGPIRLAVSASSGLQRIELGKGWESRYYLDRQEVPVLEVEVGVPCVVTTELRF